MKPLFRLTLAVALLGLAAARGAAPPDDAKAFDDALAVLKTYEHGQPRKTLTFLESAVAHATKDAASRRRVADRMVALLADAKTTHTAKVFICKQLLLVASEAHVPAVAKLLDDPKTAEMGRRTLEGIPGDASLQALRTALARLKGAQRIGAINSLGIRRDAASVPPLATLLRGSDQAAAAAAAEALGKIGTTAAATALAATEPPKALLAAWNDAELRCAANLADAGNAAAAAALYQRVWTSRRPVWCRLAGLSGLARVDAAKATPLVLQALGDEDPAVQAAALRLTEEVPGAEMTRSLLARLAGLDAPGQVRLLGVLAERGDRSAAAPVAKLLDGKDEQVRVAALNALATLGDASMVPRLAAIAAGQGGAVQAAARNTLGALSATGTDERIISAAAAGEPSVRVELIRALEARRCAAATPLLLKAAADPDDGIRAAAFSALAATGNAAAYKPLIGLLLAAKAPADARGAERALIAVGTRIASLDPRVDPLLAALKTAPAPPRPALLRALGSCGGPKALDAVRAQIASDDKPSQDAAVRVLAGWSDLAAAPDLLTLARTSKSTVHRVLALRGYLRLAGETTDRAQRLRMLESVRQIATTVEARKMLLASLADVADPAALDVAAAFLDDQPVHAEAALAMLGVGKTLLGSDRKAVQKAMKTLLEKSKDKTVVKQAEALLAEALKPPRPRGAGNVPAYDKKRSDEMKADVAKRAPKGYTVAAYLNCGPDSVAGAKGKPTLKLIEGGAYSWSGSDVRYATIFFTTSQVLFEATGLNPRKTYQLGFSWWDCDHDTRVQSVWASAGRGRGTKLLGPTKLPSGPKNQKAEEKVVPLPRQLTVTGSVRLMFRNEATPNVVVSEVWLLESDAESEVKITMPEPRPKGGTPVVVLTGIEYPGHPWRQTAPALADLLVKDPRLDVEILEDATLAQAAKLRNYKVCVLNYMNWKKPDPPAEALATFQKFVADGGGLVMVHFACGAFQKWPEFVKIAGRVWNPKLRGHDPRGTFTVNFTDIPHPTTQGMKPFETTDELYTCLDGTTPIQILATATSKVDKKLYPMVFVLTYGKGRVFHCVLGHDLRAFEADGMRELYRRGTAWAAGLPPVAPAR